MFSLAFSGSCSTDVGHGGDRVDSGVDEDELAGICRPTIFGYAATGSSGHFTIGTPIEYASNPPSFGGHYPVWYKWARVYDEPVPRPFYVHNLEHGGVVFLYSCDPPCPDIVGKLESVARGLRQDPLCSPQINARWLVTPDPLLPLGVKVAASAWGFTYTSTCVGPQLAIFANKHIANGPEDLCGDGALP